MFSHSILLPLVIDVVLVLGQAVDSIKPTLAVVLGQDVGGRADPAGDVVLDPRPGVRCALESRLASPTSFLSVKTASQIQSVQRVLHFPTARFNNSE